MINEERDQKQYNAKEKLWHGKAQENQGISKVTKQEGKDSAHSFTWRSRNMTRDGEYWSR